MNLELSMQNTMKIIQSVIALKPELIESKDVKNLINSYSYYQIWKHEGRHMFLFSDRLAVGLQNTSVPDNFCFADFYLPFDSFMLQCNNGFVGPEVVKSDKFYFKDNFNYILILRTKLIRQLAKIVMKDLINIKEINTQGEYQIMFIANNTDQEGVYDYFFMPIMPTYTIEMLCKAHEYKFIPGIKQVLNSAINAVLYINDPTHRQYRETREMSELVRPHEKGKKRFDRYHYTYLSAPIREYKEGAKNRSPYSNTFWIRGHWRNQAFGEGRKEHKYIWIKPYIKGQGEESRHAYKVI